MAGSEAGDSWLHSGDGSLRLRAGLVGQAAGEMKGRPQASAGASPICCRPSSSLAINRPARQPRGLHTGLAEVPLRTFGFAVSTG